MPEQPETVELYGHEVKLPQPGNGAIITDVVLIVRQVMTNEDGDLDDDIGLSLTSQTTGCILTGMLTAANAIDVRGWQRGADAEADDNE